MLDKFNWRQSFIVFSDTALTSEIIKSKAIKVGDLLYTTKNLYSKNKLLFIANKEYKMIGNYDRYSGGIVIESEQGGWVIDILKDDPTGGGQYFYVKKDIQFNDVSQNISDNDNTNTENKTENEPTTPEDKESDALSQFGEVPTMIAKNLLKTKTFRWVNFLDYATNQSLKNDFGSDVQKMQQHRDEIRQRISKALIFMAQYKYIANREDHTLYVTQYGYHKIFG
ncbi:MAG: hypothetical protein M0R17_02320 [Candidatus Omnitrophica bacterium]|jgi:hypothetical protein|nr:hypothetical protein [Candidatus Omnitrophota bacterium]